ncbi:MAG: hypothetical protein ABEJ31_00465 [Haloarculaceae archaeon]
MDRSRPVGRGRERAQSTPIGYLLIVVMVLLGATAAVALGSSALSSTQTQSELQRAEHTLTLFDSRVAMVALGASESQRVSFGQGGGAFETHPDAGWLKLSHHNYTSGHTETLYNRSLGAFVYHNGPTDIAYQGGGVWRRGRTGAAQMISPPEFHYRESTLTLPIVRVHGGSSGSGDATAVITNAGPTRQVFPNESTSAPPGPGAPYDATGEGYRNPVDNGTVYAWVHSRYYRGWAEYFRKRTTGTVTVFDANQTVKLNLVSLGGQPGDFTPPDPANAGGGAVEVGGFGTGHPLQSFELNLKGSNFQNAHWSLWSDAGTNELEIHMLSAGKCKNNGGYDGHVELRVFYRNTSTGRNQEWYAEIDNSTASNPTAIRFDCGAGVMHVDFTNTDSTMEYQDVVATGTTNKWQFPDDIDKPTASSVTLDEHPPVDGNRLVTAGTGDTATVDFVVNHYMSLLPLKFDLKVQAGPGASNRIDEGASTGRLEYTEATGTKYITFLHVTENDVRIDVR